tara:strand:+ start:508 stop:873 length:366 start_codon:yes stop_codon:yes gene_type:complete
MKLPSSLPIEFRWDAAATHCVKYYYGAPLPPGDDLALLIADKNERDVFRRLVAFQTQVRLEKDLDIGLRPNPTLIPSYRQRHTVTLKRRTEATAYIVVMGSPLPHDEADARGNLRLVDVEI